MRVPPALVRTLIAGAAVAAVSAVLVGASGGGAIALGGLVLRSHNPARPAAIAVVLLALAFAAGASAVRDALDWWGAVVDRSAAAVAAAAAAAAMTVGIAWGTFAAGGSDSYCYLNQAELFTQGRVRDFEALARDPGWPGNVWSFAPAGHTPDPAAPGYYVPICPAGYPVLLAGARLAFGRTAMFWVTPILGAAAVWFTFLLGRRAAGPAAGLLAGVLAATSPVLLYQVVQPMNDVPAAALWTAALAAATTSRWSDRRRAALAGLAAGIAITIRPNLVPLAALVGVTAAWLPRARPLIERVRTLAIAGLTALPGVIFVMLVQRAMYGSPLTSGYGDVSTLFSLSHVWPNLGRYPAWLIETHTPMVLVAALAPVALPTGDRRYGVALLAFAAVTLLCYLPYVVFDAWWYLRFLLPAILPLLALTAAVVVAALRRVPPGWRVVPYAAILVGMTATFVSTAVRRDVFRLQQFEQRFRTTGEFVASLPPSAALVTGHHSGSVRFYAGRTFAGWGDIERGRLDEALRFLERKGLDPYLLFEDWEEPQFRERFAGEPLGALDWPPRALIGEHVRLYDPDDRERHRRGEPVETLQIAVGRR